jgi:YVTN family beta-propeller protein
LQVIDSVQVGWGPLNMAIDPERGFLYLAHSDPNETYPHNISVVDLGTLAVTPITSVPDVITSSRDVAVELESGYAYVSNTSSNSVSVLDGPVVIGHLPAGEDPWGVGVNPNDGYVFVTNRGSNNVTVIREGAVVDTIVTHGLQPVDAAVDTINNEIYIANRGRETDLFECRDASVSILR